MDKIEKFLLKLSRKDRCVLSELLRAVRELKLDGCDVKKLKGMDGVFRLRKGKIRILFAKVGGHGVVLKVGMRKDVY